MNDELTIDVPENWKETLRGNILIGIAGSLSEKMKAFTSIGYAYQCYAPASIYKYFPPDKKRFEAIKENKLWYSAPSKFNDVFDSDFPIDRNAIFDSILSQVPDSKGVRKGSPMWKELQTVMSKSVKQFRETMGHIRCTTGVACFSESYDSLLMWSHYAQNHQGICVEYELLKFNTELKFSPVPIIYSNERTRLSAIDMDNMGPSSLAFFIGCLTTKSIEWSYENEWRIIRDSGACGKAWNDEKHGALLPSVTPSSIILGCDTSEEFEKEVCDYCEERKINLFKMEKDEAEYRLNKKLVMQFDS